MRLNFGHAELAVVLFDLLARTAQVAHVAQNRHDAGAAAWIFGDRAEKLEQQVRPIQRVDEQQLAPGGAGFLDGLARERRGKEHVVHPRGAAPSFALLLRRGEQGQRAGIRDEQAPFRIGEQNRVGDGIDDAVQQRSFAALLAIALGKRLLPENLIELLAEDRGEPVKLMGEWRGARNQQKAERFFRHAGHSERDDVKGRVLKRRPRPAPAFGGLPRTP